jgi:hypothetical protein
MVETRRRLREEAIAELLALRETSRPGYAAVLQVVRVLADKPDKTRR